MRFFATLSILATLGCSAFTSALPTPEPKPAALAVGSTIEARAPLVARTQKSVPQIIADVTSQLQEPLGQLCMPSVFEEPLLSTD